MTSPPPDAPAREPAETANPLALIVDDNERNRKLARDLLRAARFRTLEAGTGGEAIAIANEDPPDVILMDLQLPDMSGHDAVRTLREGARTSRVPVLAVSARRLATESDWLHAVGFAGYLEKPIDVGGFAEQVRRYCAAPGG